MIEWQRIEDFIKRIRLRVIETHNIRDGICSCTRGINCNSSGKHPKEKNWQNLAKPPSDARPLFTRVQSRKSNYAILTDANCFALDFDGEPGRRTFEYLSAEIRAIRDAPRVRTQSGGLHVYLSVRGLEGIVIPNKTKLLPGMDVRGQGGFVIGPGSVGKLGPYTIEQEADSVPELSAPDLEMLLLHPHIPKLPKKSQGLRAEGTRNDDTFRTLCYLRNAGLNDVQIANAALGINAFNAPPLEQAELNDITDSVCRYDQKKEGKNKPKAPKYSSEESPNEDVSTDEVLPLLVDAFRSVEWRGAIQLNEFTDEIEITRRFTFLDPYSREYKSRKFSDIDVAVLRDRFTRELEKPVSADHLYAAVNVVANENRFHPVKAYLKTLSWDSKPRVETFLPTYFGAKDEPYAALVSKCLLLSLIARVITPGCQVDTAPILEGAQGIGKSQGLRALGGEYFGDPCLDLASKDAFLQIQGLWLVELPELDSLRRRGASTAKAFITTSVDRYRPPYGRVVKDQPRQCVFVGTTNESHYLHDPTGNRRFLPIKVNAVNVQAIVRDRDQLFAEAYALYLAGTSWWPEGDEVTLAQQEQASRVEVHPWEDKLGEILLIKHPEICEISSLQLFDLLGLSESHKDKDKQTILGQIMRNLGFERKRRGKAGTHYIRPTAGITTSHVNHLIPLNPDDSSSIDDSLYPAGCATHFRLEVANVEEVVIDKPSSDEQPASLDLDRGAL